MDFPAFERLLVDLCADIPADYFDGVTEVTASPRTLPHPSRSDIFTLGECIPIPLVGSDAESVQSRIVLYHGSFRALAESDPDFNWRDEAWETLTHELRHHVEWRAMDSGLEAFDRAAEANFARHEGEPFDPLFHLDGVAHGAGVYQVGDDWFVDRVVRRPSAQVTLPWRGRFWRLDVPATATLPTYLAITDVADPPPGDLVLVLRRAPRLGDLLRSAAEPSQFTVRATMTTQEA